MQLLPHGAARRQALALLRTNLAARGPRSVENSQWKTMAVRAQRSSGLPPSHPSSASGVGRCSAPAAGGAAGGPHVHSYHWQACVSTTAAGGREAHWPAPRHAAAEHAERAALHCPAAMPASAHPAGAPLQTRSHIGSPPPPAPPGQRRRGRAPAGRAASAWRAGGTGWACGGIARWGGQAGGRCADASSRGQDRRRGRRAVLPHPPSAPPAGQSAPDA